MYKTVAYIHFKNRTVFSPIESVEVELGEVAEVSLIVRLAAAHNGHVYRKRHETVCTVKLEVGSVLAVQATRRQCSGMQSEWCAREAIKILIQSEKITVLKHDKHYSTLNLRAQSFQTQIGLPQPLPSTCFRLYYSLNILRFDTI
jgi:hypothetical protein